MIDVNGAAPASPSREYIYSGSALLATIEGATVKYQMSDHLSARLTTDATGAVLGQQGHFPFGESWYATSSATKWKFTSYERDSESGNDYAMMRSYINRLGRFSSPDPLAGSIGNPQSLNRYIYTLSDPISFADPLGLERVFAPGISITVTANVDTFDPSYFGLGGILGPFGGGGIGGRQTKSLNAPPVGIDEGAGGYHDPLAALGIGPKPPPPPPGYEQCITAALEEILAFGEGTANAPGEGYGLLVYGTVKSSHGSFTSLNGMTFGPNNPFTIENPEALSGHPRIFVAPPGCSDPRCWSSAFGRFQITYTTATQLGFVDFSPAGQRAAAATMLNSTGAIQAAMQGNLRGAISSMGAWASIPGSPLPGRKKTWQDVQAVFQNALNTLPECQ